MNVFWYMCAPDGAYPWQPEGSRQVDYGYYKQLAQAYDHLGYTGALFATGAHDVWVLASALLAHTERCVFSSPSIPASLRRLCLPRWLRPSRNSPAAGC
jgi:alkanesulfonate monooxygenase